MPTANPKLPLQRLFPFSQGSLTPPDPCLKLEGLCCRWRKPWASLIHQTTEIRLGVDHTFWRPPETTASVLNGTSGAISNAGTSPLSPLQWLGSNGDAAYYHPP
ncbi:hypothetical protein FOC4_g10006752 [Fusarium odoratissimum]|uniref:Uncharacterized protein n=1 Tax=Fusarium oxysporum f. sp. cubense (strain race 4) TaxID=2502994 RepID=N1RIE0_FUSC4|nr:hypothetical protein FOC4_g10006752 [Fusarium odoratissimum]